MRHNETTSPNSPSRSTKPSIAEPTGASPHSSMPPSAAPNTATPPPSKSSTDRTPAASTAFAFAWSAIHAEAEDLAQEAFLQLFRKIHTFRGESAFSSWLHRLTANVVLMSFRKKKAHLTSLDEISSTNDDDAGQKLEIGEADLRLAGIFDRVNLQAAIESLPEGYKRMFLLHDLHGYEHNEIAEILDCSVGNSKSQVHKARKRLRESLRKVERYKARTQSHPPTSLAVAARFSDRAIAPSASPL